MSFFKLHNALHWIFLPSSTVEPNASSRRSWFPESPVLRSQRNLILWCGGKDHLGMLANGLAVVFSADGSPEAFEPPRPFFITLVMKHG
ncbi:unnamed protein product [Brassica napus]|uniref:(rape) hypothetical protein n=1 Tax=Brassica napus TaxID=3708 RepID=A0A816U0B5_BRANA|nr:unnamed protein product [Brassica napus]